MLNKVILLCCCLSATVADAGSDSVDTLPPAPKPYAFGYAAGRFPGHIDRTHSEVSDGSGVVHGSYSYVDPSFQIRKVDYVADQNGFHPILNKNAPALPNDTPVVAAAKERHLVQYARIADQHQHVAQGVAVPQDSNAVEYAKNKHLYLFQKIAEEHARIAAEREALNLSQHPNSLEQEDY